MDPYRRDSDLHLASKIDEHRRVHWGPPYIRCPRTQSTYMRLVLDRPSHDTSAIFHHRRYNRTSRGHRHLVAR